MAAGLSCRVCSGELRLLLPGSDAAAGADAFSPSCHELGLHGDLLICHECGAVEQPGLPSGAELHALYRELQRSEAPPSWVESGSIRLASSPDRLAELRRQLSWARVFGLPMQEISPAEAKALFPPMSTDGVLGGVLMSSDGQVDPSQLCYSLAARARAGGVLIAQHTTVLGISIRDGRVTGVRTDRGDIEAEIVVNCGGIFAAEIGRMAGIRVPIVPMSHQYVVTQPLAQHVQHPRAFLVIVFIEQLHQIRSLSVVDRRVAPLLVSKVTLSRVVHVRAKHRVTVMLFNEQSGEISGEPFA